MSDSSDYIHNFEADSSARRTAEKTTSNQESGPTSSFNCFKGCSGKIGPDTRFNEEECEIESEESDSDEELPDTAESCFKDVFRISQDNKLAMKVFGSKSSILKELKRQKRYRHWVIHPYSSFRYVRFGSGTNSLGYPETEVERNELDIRGWVTKSRWNWDLLMVILLFVTVIALPVSIAFYQDENPIYWSVLYCFTDFIFLVDLALNFRTGIIGQDGHDQVILNLNEIYRRYVRGWFCVDLISSIPFDYFTLIAASFEPENKGFNVSLIKASRALRILRVAKLLSLVRLLRISRLLRYIQRWEELFDVAGSVLRIINLIGTMLLLAHWNGCIQFLVSYLQGASENSWISIDRLEGKPVSVQYTWSLFKAISHMLCIGYGRFPPQTVGEVWITILSMLAGATFYAIFIGHMSSLLMHIDSSGRLYNDRWNQMEEYLKYRKVPGKVKQRIADYYEHRYRGKFFDEKSILENLSPPLRASVIKHNCSALVKAVPYFKEADNKVLNHVLAKLTFQVYLANDVIVEEGSIGEHMYFIQHGTVEVSSRDGSVNKRLTEGAHFGEIDLLTDMRRVATVRAVTMCDLFALHRDDFASISADYPNLRKAIEVVALQRIAEQKKGSLVASFETDEVNRKGSSSKPDVLSHSLATSQAAASTGADINVGNKSLMVTSRSGVTAAQGRSTLGSGFHALEERRRLSALEEEEDESDTL